MKVSAYVTKGEEGKEKREKLVEERNICVKKKEEKQGEDKR